MLLHRVLLGLGVQEQSLQGLYKVEYLLLVIVEVKAYVLNLLDQLMEQLLLLGVVPIIRCF
jgi:hypothetical protein